VSGRSKPWRILPCAIPSRAQNFRQRPDAYTAALGLAKQGADVRIYEFDPRFGWKLYEIVRAAGAAAAGPDAAARPAAIEVFGGATIPDTEADR
jgi:hypothetical protein